MQYSRRFDWEVRLKSFQRAVFFITFAAAPASAVELDVASFIDMARGTEIVVLGEIHDNPQHHENQANIVRTLTPDALVFEMIPQALEAVVNELRAAGATRDEIAAALDWANSGWPDFDLYAPVLEAAPNARIFGAGQSAEDVQKAARDGAAAAFGRDAATYGLDVPLAKPDQSRRERQMADAHCNALPEAALAGMVEVQRFRDASLADAALWARTLSGLEGQVVVIAGDGHANRSDGIPALIGLSNPDVSVLSLGQLEAYPVTDDSPYDAYIISPAPERDDPCADFESPDD